MPPPRRLLSLARSAPPRVPSLSRRLCRRPPSPAVSAPSLSLRWLLSLARQRPPSPAVVVATAATDGGGCTRQIAAVRRRPRRPVNLRHPAPPQSLLPPSHLCRRHCRQSCAFWAKYLFTYRGISSPVSKKQKSITAQLLRKLGLFQDFQQG